MGLDVGLFTQGACLCEHVCFLVIIFCVCAVMWVLGRHSIGFHSAFYIICQMSSINNLNHVLDLSNYLESGSQNTSR